MLDRVTNSKNAILVCIAGVGSMCSEALGGWDGFLKILVAMMVCDYITGVLVAAIWKSSGKSHSGALDSNACFKGIVKKGIILMLVWLGALMDEGLGVAYVRNAICMFFIGNEGLSLLENMGLMGVPYPKQFKDALEALRKQGDSGTASIEKE